ncbi:hypothetical protein EBR43_05115 [bacterium]|nr:hypothetical protein [bacterium]
MSFWLNFGFDISKYSIELNMFIPSFDFVLKRNFDKGMFWFQLGPFTLCVTDNKKINDWFEANYPVRHQKRKEEGQQ